MSYRPFLFRAKELENTSVATVDSYIEALEMSNLIYLARPMDYFRKAFADTCHCVSLSFRQGGSRRTKRKNVIKIRH